MDPPGAGEPTAKLKSLRTYDLTLAEISISMGLCVLINSDDENDVLAWFSDVEDCALFILAKYSHGLKLHKHIWDLAINGMVIPAYTVHCMIPGCPAELTVPHVVYQYGYDKGEAT